MFIDLDYCECTVDYGNLAEEDGIIKGRPTKMDYLGEGIYQCPECKEKVDYSEHIFKVKVEITLEEDFKVLKIIGGEERINHHWHNDEKYLIIKDCIEEDLYEGSGVIGKWLINHEVGIFDIEVYYEPTSYWTDCGTEYDLNMFIVKEVKAGSNADSHDDGIPPKDKSLGILPTIL